MTRGLWCVLLLSTGIALAGEAPDPKRPAEPAVAPAKAQAKPPATAAKAAKPAPKPAETPKATDAPRPSETPKPAEEPKPTDAAKPAEAPKPGEAEEAKESPDLGMSILGNQEAPKALVIVPWKTSEMGDAHGISTMLDDSRLPIDKEVFMRLLSYYEIRSDAGPTATPTATPRRKQ